MEKQTILDKDALFRACKEVASQTLWQNPRPEDISDIIDTDQIDKTTQGYFEKALRHAEFVTEENLDPNLITRAVLYLAQTHAIPPMKEDLAWFNNMLEVLIELACPNVIHSKEVPQFLFDIEKGVKSSLQNISNL